MIEIPCTKDIIFHFNKKHLEDPSIPMWVIKAKGQTMYVNHVTCQVPWSTKETPDSTHTKGAIKIKNALLTINDNNEAEITPLTAHDIVRLKNQEKGYQRILVPWSRQREILDWCKQTKVKHGVFKSVQGGCGSSFYVTDIMDRNGMAQLALTFTPQDYRILNPNEAYYQAYDDPVLLARINTDPDGYLARINADPDGYYGDPDEDDENED